MAPSPAVRCNTLSKDGRHARRERSKHRNGKSPHAGNSRYHRADRKQRSPPRRDLPGPDRDCRDRFALAVLARRFGFLSGHQSGDPRHGHRDGPRQQPADGRRYQAHLYATGAELHGLQRGRIADHRHDRRRRGRRGRPGQRMHSQTRDRLTALGADLYSRLRRHFVERRLGRRLSRADPAGRHRVFERRPASAGGAGAGLCGRRQRLQRQYADQAARCRPH
jgi:hypothetical protein